MTKAQQTAQALIQASIDTNDIAYAQYSEELADALASEAWDYHYGQQGEGPVIFDAYSEQENGWRVMLKDPEWGTVDEY